MLKKTGHNKCVDWYLLGVLLHEMLIGNPPYFNQNRFNLYLIYYFLIFLFLLTEKLFFFILFYYIVI